MNRDPQTANNFEHQIKRKSWKRAGMIALCTLLVLVCALGGTVYAVLHRGLPQTTGSLPLPGLTVPATVTRDAEGIPHIVAQNQHDAYMAQGYVHAQDRLFQMDLSRRQASGRLAEVFGEMAVDTDKMFRTLGLRRAAERSVSAYSADAMASLSAYADGVNAYIQQNKGKLSFEFLLNGYTPEPWTPTDTITIAKYMAHDLGGHWESQAFRQYLLDHFPEAEALELFPEGIDPINSPLIIPDAPGAQVADVFLSATVSKPDEWNGSNDWVISGSKTESGQPILCDDPHLGIASPSIWYQNHLQIDGFNMSGVIFAGAPGIILGHNDAIAWGVTNTGPDVQDLYIEKLNPANPTQYEYQGAWQDAIVHNEDITIKGGAVVPFTVLETRHGPIISELAQATQTGTAYSLQWTALEASAEIEAMLNMNFATDWPSFEKALEQFRAPMQNFVFAAQDGTIAYKANGALPIRAKGDGLLPVPGWTGEYEWTGYVPFDELPRVVNPPQGFVATANHKVIGDSYPYHVSHVWAQPYRQQRIVEVLSAKDKLTVADVQALQADVKDLHAAEMVPLFLTQMRDVTLTDRQKTALALLEAWDYQTQEDKAEPLIFGIWFNRLTDVLFSDAFSAEGAALFTGKGYTVDGIVRRVASGKSSAWADKVGGLPTALQLSLAAALDEIEGAQGKDMSKWSWGAFHQVGFVHPLSSVSFLRPIFNPEGRKPSPGTNTTVCAASWRDDGLNNHGASWRFVRDLSQPDFAWHIVAPGNSGHPLSPYYHKQIDRWIQGEQYQTYVTGFAGDTLTLKPAQ